MSYYDDDYYYNGQQNNRYYDDKKYYSNNMNKDYSNVKVRGGIGVNQTEKDYSAMTTPRMERERKKSERAADIENTEERKGLFSKIFGK